MLTIMFLVTIGLIGFALIFVDIMKIFSPAILERQDGQSKKVILGFWLIGISIVSIMYKIVW